MAGMVLCSTCYCRGENTSGDDFYKILIFNSVALSTTNMTLGYRPRVQVACYDCNMADGGRRRVIVQMTKWHSPDITSGLQICSSSRMTIPRPPLQLGPALKNGIAPRWGS